MISRSAFPALLPKSAVETGGDLEGFPGRRALATVARDLGAHLRVPAACRGNEDDSFEGSSQFLRVAALSAARSSQHERHCLPSGRWHASINTVF